MGEQHTLLAKNGRRTSTHTHTGWNTLLSSAQVWHIHFFWALAKGKNQYGDDDDSQFFLEAAVPALKTVVK